MSQPQNVDNLFLTEIGEMILQKYNFYFLLRRRPLYLNLVMELPGLLKSSTG